MRLLRPLLIFIPPDFIPRNSAGILQRCPWFNLIDVKEASGEIRGSWEVGGRGGGQSDGSGILDSALFLSRILCCVGVRPGGGAGGGGAGTRNLRNAVRKL